MSTGSDALPSGGDHIILETGDTTAYEMMKELMAVLDPMRRGRRLWDTDLFRMVLLSG